MGIFFYGPPYFFTYKILTGHDSANSHSNAASKLIMCVLVLIDTTLSGYPLMRSRRCKSKYCKLYIDLMQKRPRADGRALDYTKDSLEGETQTDLSDLKNWGVADATD